MQGLDILSSTYDSEAKSAEGKKLGYIFEPGVIPLSFSRLGKLYTCPRKFLIDELNHNSETITSFDMAYGSAFGAGVQELFRSGDLELATIMAFATWDHDEFDSSKGFKRDKWLWACIWSVEQFYNSEFQTLIQDYELAYLDGTVGIEPLIYCKFSDSYSYQMHIDLILKNRHNEALVVAEIKTSGMSQQEANWGNSDQTVGYYTVLEHLCKRYNLPYDPEVLYIVQETGKQLKYEENFGFITFRFDKGEHTSLDFVMKVLSDVQVIELYLENQYFPKRGSSCVNFGKVCRHYGMCDMHSLTDPDNKQSSSYTMLTVDDADFVIDLSSLIGDLVGA